jgi:hypothetical protein
MYQQKPEIKATAAFNIGPGADNDDDAPLEENKLLSQRRNMCIFRH